MNILSHVYKFYLLFCPWCFSIGVGYINVGECKGLLMLSRVLSFPFNRFFYVRLLLFSVSWPSNYSLPANPASRYTILLSFSCLSSPFPTSNTIYFWASFVSLRRKPQNKFFFLSFKKKKKNLNTHSVFCYCLLFCFCCFYIFLWSAVHPVDHYHTLLALLHEVPALLRPLPKTRETWTPVNFLLCTGFVKHQSL